MQIDFHHGVTYVVSRLAGLSHQEADVVAYCAQYVDDATEQGALRFTNGAMYNVVSSAHKTVDYRNFKKMANHHVWIPFHFLPGNGGKPAGENPSARFIDKLIARPNSYVAQDMVAECIKRKDRPYALHLLGVTAHVFADTFAHRGFAGVTHDVNRVQKLLDDQNKDDKNLWARLKTFFKDKMEDDASAFLSDVKPLGHGAALSNPDKPYLKWSYVDGLGRPIERDNPKDFVEAADELCKVIQRFIAGDAKADVDGLPLNDKNIITTLLCDINDENGDDRHEKWLSTIARGEFSFGAQQVSYHEKGVKSWLYQALRERDDLELQEDRFKYDSSFLESNWKYFHDAVQCHRLYVVHDILPRYGICAA